MTAPAQLAKRFDALRDIVRYAVRELPYYRRRYADALFDPEKMERPEDLRRAPFLERGDLVRHFPEGFVPEHLDLGTLLDFGEIRLLRTHFGGARMETFSDDVWERASARTAINDQATLRSLSENRALRRASYWTIVSAGVPCIRDMPSMELRLDTRSKPPLLRLPPPEEPSAPTVREIEKLFLEMETHGTEWLDCYGPYLALVARVAIDEGLELPALKVITTSARTLSAIQRRIIEEAWRCPVIVRAGGPDIGAWALYECDRRMLHLNESHAWFEILKDGEPVKSGDVGHLVITTLHHRVPLIRYASGRLVEAGSGQPCACGSPHAWVKAYAGLEHEVLVSYREPVPQHRVDAVLQGFAPIEQYQATQNSAGRVTIRVRTRSPEQAPSFFEQLASDFACKTGILPKVELGRIHVEPSSYELPLLRTSHAQPPIRHSRLTM